MTGLAEVGGDLGLQLVVADADRAVQPRPLQHRRPHGRRHLPRVAEVAVPLARAEERLVPAEHLEHHGDAAPLQRPDRRHHLRRRGEVVRGVDRQEDRVRALLVRRAQRHARPDAELPGLVGRRRDHRALVDDAAAADHDGLARQLGLAQDLHRRQEHVEVDVEHPAGPGRLMGLAPEAAAAVGGLELVEPGQQQQVGDHRPDLGEDHLGVEVGGALDLAGGVADRDAARAARRRPSGRPSARGPPRRRRRRGRRTGGRTTRAPAGGGTPATAVRRTRTRVLRSARSIGSTRSTIRRTPGLCRTRNGDDATTARPSSAAARSSVT